MAEVVLEVEDRRFLLKNVTMRTEIGAVPDDDVEQVLLTFADGRQFDLSDQHVSIIYPANPAKRDPLADFSFKVEDPNKV